jgi:hypothetical protein
MPLPRASGLALWKSLKLDTCKHGGALPTRAYIGEAPTATKR